MNRRAFLRRVGGAPVAMVSTVAVLTAATPTAETARASAREITVRICVDGIDARRLEQSIVAVMKRHAQVRAD